MLGLSLKSSIFWFFSCVILAAFFVVSYLFWPLEVAQNRMKLNAGSNAGIIAQLNALGFSFGRFDGRILSMLGGAKSGFVEIVDVKVKQKMPRILLLKRIANAKPVSLKITLLPGETSHFFLREISAVFDINIDELESAYNELIGIDGWILPETYSLAYGMSAVQIVSTLKKISDTAHRNLARELLGRYEPSEWLGILSKAAIIQKEAADVDEMPLVAAVIENRLRLNMPLQMDGSLNYGAFSHAKVTPERIRSDATRFNTYRFKGVPPTPVASVSIHAIRAALNPAPVDYLYFVRNRTTGKHEFSKTYKEHKRKF